MRFTSIKTHLRPYEIRRNRTTTINHAFASAIAPCDSFHEERIRKALRLLNQDPDCDLLCAYCGEPADTWDHVVATVRDREFSGHGHRLGNLLPCCKQCNSRKGNKDWRRFLGTLPIPVEVREAREKLIGEYLEKFLVVDTLPENVPEYHEFVRIRFEILELMTKADELARQIRSLQHPR